MSVLTLPALGLATRAVSALPGLFTAIAQRTVAPDIVRLESTGHTVEGRGAASYIADALATTELLVAHPRFVARTADGRIFRLLPQAGTLSVEQGGAIGDGIANDQAAVQAAIDYAQAAGVREVAFERALYRIDCPIRTSPREATHAPDGHPLVLRRSLTLRGAAGVRTVLDFRGLDGADPETSWQTIPISAIDAAPAVWRGGGLFLLGETADPGTGPRALARVELDRLILKGNRRRTGRYNWPVDLATGDGWDVTDKAVWLQDTFAGEIVMRDVDCVGWKGEIVYLAGQANAVERVTLTRCRFLTSNGSAFNPGVNAVVTARDCEFGDCFQAQEDTAKTRAHYTGCLWHDCDHMGLGGGATAAVSHNPAYPTRDPAQLPMTVLENCEFRACGILTFASWVTGRIRTVDTMVVVDGNHHGAVRDVDLAIDAWLDQADGINALALYGPSSLTEQVPGAAPGTYKQPLEHLRFQLRHYRTQAAAEAGRQWRGPMWNGYLRPTCRIVCEGDFASQTTPNGGASPVAVPYVAMAGGEGTTQYTSHGWFLAPAYTQPGEIAVTGPVMAIEVAADATLDMTLARWPGGGPAFGYAEGQQVRLVKNDARGAIRFVKGANPLNAEVNATRTLKAAHDWIAFTFNASIRRWEESGFFSAV